MDDGWSGTDFRRPGFQRMMEAQQSALAEQQRQQQRNAQNDAMRRR